MHNFGDNVDKVVKPTTREAGSAAAMNLEVYDRQRQARDAARHASSSPRGGGGSNRGGDESNPERRRAIQELEREKETTYNDLKAAIGKTEADQQIKTYMNGTYKKRMEEINRMYPKGSSSGTNRAQSSQQEKQRR